MRMIQEGADALDAVIAGVNLVEDDPNDNSVGYGGFAQRGRIVELDSSVMHGPSGRWSSRISVQHQESVQGRETCHGANGPRSDGG